MTIVAAPAPELVDPMAWKVRSTRRRARAAPAPIAVAASSNFLDEIAMFVSPCVRTLILTCRPQFGQGSLFDGLHPELTGGNALKRRARAHLNSHYAMGHGRKASGMRPGGYRLRDP